MLEYLSFTVGDFPIENGKALLGLFQRKKDCYVTRMAIDLKGRPLWFEGRIEPRPGRWIWNPLRFQKKLEKEIVRANGGKIPGLLDLYTV